MNRFLGLGLIKVLRRKMSRSASQQIQYKKPKSYLIANKNVIECIIFKGFPGEDKILVQSSGYQNVSGIFDLFF